jgi:hypothetical protein
LYKNGSIASIESGPPRLNSTTAVFCTLNSFHRNDLISTGKFKKILSTFILILSPVDIEIIIEYFQLVK